MCKYKVYIKLKLSKILLAKKLLKMNISNQSVNIFNIIKKIEKQIKNKKW